MKRPIRIGWICNSGIGPSETFLVDTLKTLSEMGDVHAISGVSAGQQQSFVNHSFIPFKEHSLKLRHTLLRKLTGENIHRKELQKRCDRMMSPSLHEFDPEFIWVEFGTTAVVGRSLLLRLNKPYFIAVHGYDITTEFRDEQYKNQFVEVSNHPNSIGVICASEYTKRLCILAGVNPEKCRVIRLSLDSERIKPLAEIQKTEEPSFVHFGRLTEKKHPIATLEAFRLVLKDLPSASLTYIGDGPLSDELRNRIEDAGLSKNVRMLGAMDREAALKEVQRHWDFCQHSVTAKSGDQEGFALSPAEAALLEMPVVSTIHNGIPEHVLDGKTGYLVPEFDFVRMAERMVELAEDSELRNRFGKAGRKNVEVICSGETRKRELSNLFG